jgi:hypothetical protein
MAAETISIGLPMITNMTPVNPATIAAFIPVTLTNSQELIDAMNIFETAEGSVANTFGRTHPTKLTSRRSPS